MKAELVPENGDPPIRIMKDLTLVGRHEDCDVVIDNPALSKRHCILVKTDGLLVIRDLATTNGTKVKGQRVRWAALLPDDRISLGGYKMRVYLGSDEIASPSEQPQAARGVPGVPGTGLARPAHVVAPRPAERGAATHAARPVEGSFAEPSPLDLPVAGARDPDRENREPAGDREIRFELLEADDAIIDLE
jgi:predicted component of type VI protein secretion system